MSMEQKPKKKGLPVVLQYIVGVYLGYLGGSLIWRSVTGKSESVGYLIAGVVFVVVAVLYLVHVTRMAARKMEEDQATSDAGFGEAAGEDETAAGQTDSDDPAGDTAADTGAGRTREEIEALFDTKKDGGSDEES